MFFRALWLIHDQGICFYGHVLDARWAEMLSCREAGRPTSAPRAACQRHGARTQHRRAWSAEGPFPSRIFLSNLATLGACWCASATAAGPRHPLQMAVSREVRVEIRKRTMTDSPLHIRPGLSLLPSHASGGNRDRMLYPVFVLQRGDKPFISNLTQCRGSVVKSMRRIVGPNPWNEITRVWVDAILIIVLLSTSLKWTHFSLHHWRCVCVLYTVFAWPFLHILAYDLEAISLVNLPLHAAALLLDWIRLD